MNSAPDSSPQSVPDLDKLKDETASAFEKVRLDVEHLKTIQQIENDVLDKKPAP